MAHDGVKKSVWDGLTDPFFLLFTALEVPYRNSAHSYHCVSRPKHIVALLSISPKNPGFYNQKYKRNAYQCGSQKRVAVKDTATIFQQPKFGGAHSCRISLLN